MENVFATMILLESLVFALWTMVAAEMKPGMSAAVHAKKFAVPINQNFVLKCAPQLVNAMMGMFVNQIATVSRSMNVNFVQVIRFGTSNTDFAAKSAEITRFTMVLDASATTATLNLAEFA